MSERPGGHPVAAVVVWVVAWTMSLAALLIQLVAGVLPADDDVGFFTQPTYFALYAVMGLVNAPAAALLLSRSRRAVAWMVGVVAIGFAAAALSLALALLAVEQGWSSWAGLLGHGFTWFGVPGAFLGVTVMPWLLREEPPGRGARRAAGSGVVLTVVATLQVATSQQDDALANPIALTGTPVGHVLAVLSPICLLGLAVLGTAAVVHLVVWARTEGPEARRALGVMATSLGVLVGSFAVLQLTADDAPGRELLEQLAVPLLFGSQILMPLAVVLLVLRTRLWGVDLVVSRATVWTLLTAAVIALYLVVVWTLGHVLPDLDDEVASLFAAATLALAVQPLRTWLQRRVDRIVYGDDSDPVTLLARMGEQLRGSGHGDGTLPALVESLRTGLKLGGVEVVAHDAPAIEARSGLTRDQVRPDTEVTIPLVVEHREIGLLVLRASSGQRLDLRSVRVARHLSDVVAVSLDLAQTNQRLRNASQRLGEVRHQERRMLRRELHDGLGPSLAGVGLGMAAARRKLTHDVPGAAHLLAELETELARRTDDVRLLARSLLPVQLDEGNLGEALAVLSERFRGSGLHIDTSCDAPASLDTRHQIAIYHVAAEAVLNAYRHAGAGRVAVTVAPADDGVELEVVDDGVGVDPSARPGVGLQSMRERADELGGTLTVEPGPDGRGTQVRMLLP